MLFGVSFEFIIGLCEIIFLLNIIQWSGFFYLFVALRKVKIIHGLFSIQSVLFYRFKPQTMIV